MNTLVVENPDCPIPKLIGCMQQSNECNSRLEDWKKLARLLEAPKQIIAQWNNEILSKQKDALDIIEDIILEWKLRVSCNAKLTTLMDVFEKAGWKSINELVWKAFHNNINELTRWPDLDLRTQELVLGVECEFLGEKTSVYDCIRRCGWIDMDEVLSKNLNNTDLLELLSAKKIVLAENIVPEVPKYFIPRLLSGRCKLDPAIFNQESSDVFLVEAAGCSSLSKEAGKELIDTSTNQIRNQTVRFISLASRADFIRITKSAGSKPVHLLHKQGNDYFWEKSHGSPELLQEFVHHEQKTIPKSILTYKSYHPVCIADNTGMGKTILLASMCRSKAKENKELSLYFGFEELMRQMKHDESEHIRDTKLEAFMRQIANITGRTNLGKEIVYQLLVCKDQRVSLYLNSYDEVPSDKLKLAKWFLSCLAKSSPRVSLFVSTRLNKRNEVEEIPGRPSYNISPFSSDQQRSFLRKFWLHEYGIPNNENLTEFIASLLKTIGKFLHHDNFGIPLLCKLLGDLYAEDANDYATNPHKTGISIDIHALYDMYTTLIDFRLKDLKCGNTLTLKLIYSLAAANSLSPSLTQEYKKGIKISGVDSVFITRSGIAKASKGVNQLAKFEFSHQCFADLFLADFLVDSIFDSDNKKKKIGLNLLFEALSVELDGKNLKIHSYDCYVRDVMDLINKSVHIEDIRAKWQNIAKRLELVSEDITSVSKSLEQTETKTTVSSNDPILLVLHKWTKNLTTSTDLTSLVQALQSENFEQTADCLIRKYYRPVFKNRQLAFFLDAKLLHWSKTHTLELDIGELTCANEEKLNGVLRSCIYHDFPVLFDLFKKIWFGNTKMTPYNRDPNMWPRLVYDAAKYSRADLVSSCLEFVEKITKRSIWDFEYSNWSGTQLTPLHAAAQRGNHSIFHLLFNHCRDRVRNLKLLMHCCTVCSMNDDNETIVGKMNIMSDILRVNPQALQERDMWLQRTPLIMEFVNINLVLFLKSEMADISAYDSKYTQNLAHRAALYYPSYDISKLFLILLKSKDYHVMRMKNFKGMTPLELALQKNNSITLDQLEMILVEMVARFENNIDVDSLLYSAVVGMQSISLLCRLRQLGADVFLTWDTGKTYAHISVQYGNIEALKYFISVGIHVDERDSQGMTSLHLAINSGNHNVEKTVIALLELGADTDAKEQNGRDAIWFIRNCDNGKCIQKKINRVLQKPTGHLERDIKYLKKLKDKVVCVIN